MCSKRVPDNRFFTGFESKGLPFSGAVFGAEKSMN